jgi:hypothetical protein
MAGRLVREHGAANRSPGHSPRSELNRDRLICGVAGWHLR